MITVARPRRMAGMATGHIGVEGTMADAMVVADDTPLPASVALLQAA